MKQPDRFHHPQLDGLEPRSVLDLDPREGGHATRVKRHLPGDVIELFDGRGRHALATIIELGRRGSVRVRLEDVNTEPRPTTAIHLASAIPRGDRMDALLDMTTQIGVTRITPLIFERSQVTPASARQDRWRRVLIESCKQSRRNHVPQLDEPVALQDWLQAVPDTLLERWLADPDGAPAAKPHKSADPSSGGCVVLVGPEGGLTQSERHDAIEAGFRTMAVAPHILRVETAAVVMVATAISWLMS